MCSGGSLARKEAPVFSGIHQANSTLPIIVVQLVSCVGLWDPTGCSPPGSPVPHCLLELAQIHVH